MKKEKMWYVDIGDDSLEILDSEVEDLDNDEISLEEAGFMAGYDKTEVDDFEALSFEEDTEF